MKTVSVAEAVCKLPEKELGFCVLLGDSGHHLRSVSHAVLMIAFRASPLWLAVEEIWHPGDQGSDLGC